jgi:hypothetical protein
MAASRHGSPGLLLSATTAALLLARPAFAIQEMTRQQVIDIAQTARGYSYWWGHGRWRSDGAYHGSCSGTCPRCSHSGSYGADCSGMVAKAWQVPSPTSIDVNSHPYSTYQFRYGMNHWTRIDRGSVQKADALVYRSKNGGHVFLYDHADPWGMMWAYECKGCAAGCVLNLRSAGSAYVAIRRNNIVEPPKPCTTHDECSTGLCAWNGDKYCCRSKGFTGEQCFSDGECSSGNVCAYNGEKFVCTSPISCGESSGTGGSGGSGGASSGGSGGASSGGSGGASSGAFGGGGGDPAGCGGLIERPRPWSSIGPSYLLVGLAGLVRRRRNGKKQ